MCNLYVVEYHDEVLDIWRDLQTKDLQVIHIDAHCDMRGLYIDRRKQRAYPMIHNRDRVDPGNYLTHAIREGRVRCMDWVYSQPGGRLYDVGTVQYETDLSAQPYRWLKNLRREKGIPIVYRELKLEQWVGPNEGETLDIDWDFFASTLFQTTSIEQRVEQFLNKKPRGLPDQVFVCYSPDFSHASRPLFRHFIYELAKILHARVSERKPDTREVIQPSFYRKYIPTPLYRVTRWAYYKTSYLLRKSGIY